MIQQPDSDLAKRLKAIDDKRSEEGANQEELALEFDTVLYEAWKQLTGDARAALDILLANLEGQCVATLQTPNITDGARQFAAGQLNIVYQIQGGLDRFTSTPPNADDYVQEFGDPDTVDLGGNKLIY